MAGNNTTNEQLAAVKQGERQSTIGDVNSPYYLQPSDHPGLIFVVSPLDANGENFFTWKRNMSNALEAKMKKGFVDGTIDKPETNSQDLIAWVKCNAMVHSWLVNSIAKELQSSVTYAETAREIWKDLEEQFSQGNAPRIYELRHGIALLQQERATVSSYYGRLRGLWDELQAVNPIPMCTCGCKCGASKEMQSMHESEKVYDFLMGLDNSFNTDRSQVLNKDPLPTLGQVYGITIQEEKQQAMAASRMANPENAVFMDLRPYT